MTGTLIWTAPSIVPRNPLADKALFAFRLTQRIQVRWVNLASARIVPSGSSAFDGWTEGKPTERQKQAMLDESKNARAQWKPSDEGFKLAEHLKCFVGSRVHVQFWDPIMYMPEDEGPFPVEADLVQVILRHQDGFLQAYLELSNAHEIQTADGYPAAGYPQKSEKDSLNLASQADIYRIDKVLTI